MLSLLCVLLQPAHCAQDKPGQPGQAAEKAKNSSASRQCATATLAVAVPTIPTSHCASGRKSRQVKQKGRSFSKKYTHGNKVFVLVPIYNLFVLIFSIPAMSTAARRRLMRDFKRLQEDPPAGVSGAPGENNIMLWNAVIFGPHDTPFEDGTFKLTMEFSEEYPNKPPVVKFLSKMFHPNIYADGGICLDILQNRRVWDQFMLLLKGIH